jgi:hypothetical protein
MENLTKRDHLKDLGICKENNTMKLKKWDRRE